MTLLTQLCKLLTNILSMAQKTCGICVAFALCAMTFNIIFLSYHIGKINNSTSRVFVKQLQIYDLYIDHTYDFRDINHISFDKNKNIITINEPITKSYDYISLINNTNIYDINNYSYSHIKISLLKATQISNTLSTYILEFTFIPGEMDIYEYNNRLVIKKNNMTFEIEELYDFNYMLMVMILTGSIFYVLYQLITLYVYREYYFSYLYRTNVDNRVRITDENPRL